jgi:predicted nucleotide-binding protein (sugar kinase/HSP70/actin superfamily)
MFRHLKSFEELRKSGESPISLGHKNGEGWYLAVDMALILILEKGSNNVFVFSLLVVCPVIITGKGVLKEIK